MRKVTLHEEADAEINEAQNTMKKGCLALVCCFLPQSKRRLRRCWPILRHSNSSVARFAASSSGVSHTASCMSSSRIGFVSLRLLIRSAGLDTGATGCRVPGKAEPPAAAGQAGARFAEPTVSPNPKIIVRIGRKRLRVAR